MVMYILHGNHSKNLNNLFRTNAKDRILQCRFIPRCREYIMEIVYEIETPDISKILIG